MIPQFIVFVDFDNSLLENANTDIFLFEKLRPDLIQKLSSEVPSNAAMNNRFRLLTESGVTKSDIIECLSNLTLTDPSIKYLKLLHQHNIPIHLVSDSNLLFISTILQSSKAHQFFQTINTNNYHFEGNQLVIGQSDFGFPGSPHQCNRENCEPHMCKSKIMVDILKSSNSLNTPKIYIGDGQNDFCPCTHLSEQDYIFARKDFSLHKKIQKHKEVKAKVVVWENSEDIFNYLSNKIFKL